MDVLSDVLRSVRLNGAIYFDMNASSPWVGASPSTDRIATAIMPGAQHIIAFHAVISGACWAAISDGSVPPAQLGPGDVVVFPGGAANVMSSARGLRGEPNMAIYQHPLDRPLPFSLVHGGGGPERTRFICGYLGCDLRPFNPLLEALPPMICARNPAEGRGWFTDLFEVAMHEGGSGREGGETILTKLSELMFVQVLRQYIESLPKESRGWLSALRDPHVGEALRLIHSRPAENWTLGRLARSAGLSRSSFAERFTHLAGVPPMQYLSRWRLQLAGRLLERPGVSIAQVGAEVGYESEAAFSRAFKRLVGLPPGAWRRNLSLPAEAVEPVVR